jgi:carbon storage regulator
MIRRRSNESILLGDDIEIQVLEIAGNRVKLGISAPRELLVLRKELHQTEEFNRDASRTVPRAHLLSLAATVLKSQPVSTKDESLMAPTEASRRMTSR